MHSEERLARLEMVVSKNGVPIRLTDERWLHIVENHDELANYHDDVRRAKKEPKVWPN